MPEFTVGQSVKYSPDLIHALRTDHKGDPLFHFAHAKEHSMPANKAQGLPAYVRRAGESADVIRLGLVSAVGRDNNGRPDGTFITGSGAAVRPHRPAKYWPAKIVRVNPDGTCDLDIEDPLGCWTHHCPDREHHPDAPGIKYDPAGKGPHTFHLDGDA